MFRRPSKLKAYKEELVDELIDDLPVFKHDFEQLLNFLRDVGGEISPTRFARIFSFDLRTLAVAAKVPVDKLWNSPHDERIQRYLRDCLQITQAAANLANSVERGVFWVKNTPIPYFGCNTGCMLVSVGRTNDVITYLNSLEAGFCG
jgi:hypothetical protein